MKKFLVLCLSALFLFALTPFAVAQETCEHVEKSFHLEFSSTIEEDNAKLSPIN